jgi:uncharacterized protein RhaS with RHS repeats
MKTEKMLLCATLLWAGLGESVFAFYNPSEGRWLSRDPIGERAGNTLYGFCGNGGPAAYDRYGLFSHTVDWHYNVSPQSIIFSQYPNAEGLTRATERMKNVSSSRASGASCDTYTVVVWARYDIYFKEGVDPSAVSLNCLS